MTYYTLNKEVKARVANIARSAAILKPEIAMANLNSGQGALRRLREKDSIPKGRSVIVFIKDEKWRKD